MKWEFLINPNSYESESSSHAMPKRKATKKQLRNLAKGRAIRKRNLLKKRKRKRRTKPKRKMAKRRRTGDTLTGGSRDVNPQFMNMFVAQTIANTIVEGCFNTPVVRIPGPGGRVTIMELLKVYWMAHTWVPAVAGLINQQQYMSISSVPQGTLNMPEYSEPNVICQSMLMQSTAFTAGGTVHSHEQHMQEIDLTDGAGHGVLYAGDRIYLQAETYAMAATLVDFPVKLLYRFKTVSLTEYVGIVQSQQ